MCLEALLVEQLRWNEVVEWCLKSQLGLVGQTLPAIPAGRPESARRIYQTLKELGNGLIGGSLERNIIHRVRFGIVELGIHAETGAEAVDSLQIGLDICLPLSSGPGGTRVLNPGRNIYGIAHWAVRIRGIHVVAQGVGGDAHIVGLVEVVELGACKCLLFYG